MKCFWVERSERWIAKVWFEGDDGWTDLGRFDTQADAQAAQDKAREGRDWQSASLSPVYKLPDGREMTSSELPPGSMFDAYWLHDHMPMEDGITLMVVLPNGVHWSPDSRAGNCGSPDDKVHTCWCRRGDPRTGVIHVDKGKPERGELSCTAGAGSIASLPQTDPHHYHGHLHRGWLTAG